MGGYTPGPWDASAVSSVVGSLITYDVTTHIAAVIPQKNKAVCEANARLIAAAPELLEACKAVLEHGAWGVQDILRAAINKAEGV